MKKAILSSILFLPFMAMSQGLHLDTCVEFAIRNFQYSAQEMSYVQAEQLALKDAGKDWLPKVVLDGMASYQNEQISIPIGEGIPGFDAPEAPLNINRLMINFSQNIYDGSVSASKKKLESSKYAMHISKLETEIMQLKSKVNGLFMGIQLANENIALTASKQKVIEERHKVLTGAAKYGGASVVNIKLLEAEMLKIDQQIIEAMYMRRALVSSLGELMGVELHEEQEFIRPTPQVTLNNSVENRPEIKILTMQIENIELQKDMMGTARLPRINAFGTLGVGNPGYDIFKEDITGMGMIGIRLQWNILDWGFANNEKQILSIDQKVVQYQQDRTRIQFKTELKNQQLEIVRYERLLKSDASIVELRQDITIIKAAELDNGTITTTDYLIELEGEDEARLNQKIHELKLIMAQLNYINIQGN